MPWMLTIFFAFLPLRYLAKSSIKKPGIRNPLKAEFQRATEAEVKLALSYGSICGIVKNK